MRHKVNRQAEVTAVQDRCRHHWIIEIANGPTSRGVCQYCGESRDFFNSITAYTELKRNTHPHTHPLDLPELPEVEMDKDSES